MIKAEQQIIEDINFLVSVDPTFAESPDDVDKVLETCEDLGGISAEYFYHEFVLMSEDSGKYHDPEYLKIDWRLS
jgi:hypothetical protein